ncbi:MAG: S1 RNA-binding domain-containing protein [Leptospiraceae bacterium]|nr:S1 RNA-binding domain-containing protein [Leptospiraceae bacterium]
MKSKQIGKNKQDQSSEFSRMLEQNLQGISELQAGSVHSLRVSDIKDRNFIFVKLNEAQGLIARSELSDSDGQLFVNVGERIDAFFLRTENGEMLFTTQPTGQSAHQILKTAMEHTIPMRPTAIRPVKGGYEVQLGDAQTFCPASHMGTESETDLNLPFLVIEAQDKRVIVSRRAWRDQLRDQQKELLQGKLSEGDTVQGKVVSIQNFGAFVDLGGIEGMIPVSELSFQRVNHPADELAIGDEVRCKVISIDWKEDRIGLSRKALLANPWQGQLPFQRGDILEGSVESIKNFGIFVDLHNGFTGLIPLAESNVPRGQNPASLYEKGQKVRVMILQLDRERERISLSVKQVKEADTRQEYENYMQKLDDDKSTSDGVSSFGKQLMAAMNNQKQKKG